MRWMWTLGLLFGSCGGGGGATRTVEPARPLDEPVPIEKPEPAPVLLDSEVDPPSAWAAPPAQPPATLVCSAKKKSTGAVKPSKTYEFEADIVLPLPYGPRIADLPRAGLPRSLRVVAEAVRAQSLRLTGCYRWARFKQTDLAGTLTARFELDEFGVASSVRVDGDPNDDGRQRELVACVKDVIAALHVRRAVPRRTDVALPILFRLSGQALPSKRPARPTTGTATAWSRRCVLAPDEVPRDPLVAAAAVLEVDDFSQRQQDEDEYELRMKEWRKSGGPRPARRPVVSVGRAVALSSIDKRTIRGVVRANAGAYRACYVEARARRPEIAGTVTLGLDITGDGVGRAVVESSTTGDGKLDECLRGAFAELWFPTSDEPLVRVHYPLTLGPAPAPLPELAARATAKEIEDGALAALAALDGERALRRWSALIAQAPDHQDACRWRLGALRALLLIAPWIDGRVMAAATELVASLEAKPDAACAEEAAETLTGLALAAEQTGWTFLEEELLEVAVERYRLILRVPGLPNEEALTKKLDELSGGLARREGYRHL